MKILVLTYEYPPVGGGGGRAAQDICVGMAKRGHDVRVLTSHWGDLQKNEKLDGVEVFRVSTMRKLSYKANLTDMAFYVSTSIFSGMKMFNKWTPDVLHVHFAVPSGPAAWVLSKMTGIPYVLTAHLGDVPGGVPEKTGRWFQWIYPFTPPVWRGAAHIAAVSAHTRNLALKHYPVDVEIVPNGVNMEQLNPGNIDVNPVPRIIFAGRFMHQKNPVQIVRTLATLRGLPWECVMLGDGPLKKDVEDEISKLKLKERFTLPGWVIPEEVVEWFRRSDILFMPSRSEGLPVVGVQALSMGLALVLSQVGGCGDLIDDGINGFLHDKNDHTGFAESLKILLQNPEKLLAFRKASRDLAVRFDINSVVESYERIFIEVVKNNFRPV